MRVLVGLLAAASLVAAGPSHKMVSVFGAGESDYDKYAAALAAMEPLKADLIDEVKASAPLKTRMWMAMRRGSVCDANFDPKSTNMRRKRACADYILKSSGAIEAMGLSVNKFNSLSRQIASDRALRRRVYQQAYFYRVGAELDGDKVPVVNTADADKRVSKRNPVVKVAAEPRVSKVQKSDAHARRFAQALLAVEDLRLKKLNTLAEDVGLKSARSLPRGICDKSLEAVASPKVKKACSEFSTEAAKAAAGFGFKAAEFNELNKKLEENRFFRARVLKHLRDTP